jgi:hypothetical protein
MTDRQRIDSLIDWLRADAWGTYLDERRMGRHGSSRAQRALYNAAGILSITGRPTPWRSSIGATDLIVWLYSEIAMAETLDLPLDYVAISTRVLGLAEPSWSRLEPFDTDDAITAATAVKSDGAEALALTGWLPG